MSFAPNDRRVPDITHRVITVPRLRLENDERAIYVYCIILFTDTFIIFFILVREFEVILILNYLFFFEKLLLRVQRFGDTFASHFRCYNIVVVSSSPKIIKKF